MNKMSGVLTRKQMVIMWGFADAIAGDTTLDGGWSRFGTCSKACGWRWYSEQNLQRSCARKWREWVHRRRNRGV